MVSGQRIEDYFFLERGGCRSSSIPVTEYIIANYTTDFRECRRYRVIVTVSAFSQLEKESREEYDRSRGSTG